MATAESLLLEIILQLVVIVGCARGYGLGVFPKSVFFIMVMMSVVTTYATVPILRRFIRGTEVQPHFDISSFAQEQG